MVTDKVADLMNRIKNAGSVNKDVVHVPYSSLKHNIAKKLVEKGYLESSEKTGSKPKHNLTLKLVYKNGAPIFSNVKRISRPGRRVYFHVHDIRPVKNGRGLLVLSTPKGILTGDEAVKERVGGESLFIIW